jgi:hypothetical protein
VDTSGVMTWVEIGTATGIFTLGCNTNTPPPA